MADNEHSTVDESLEDITARAKKAEQTVFGSYRDDPVSRVIALESINIYRAWFSIHIIRPFIEPIVPAIIHLPDSLEDAEQEAEFVYPIMDSGDVLATSKAEDMFTAGYSMCKLYYTIEKIIWLLMERLKTGGIAAEDEVQVAFHGQHAALRYAFASVINLQSNVIVSNYDPGHWGEDYLATVNRLAEKGYGYPEESPRDVFRKKHSPAAPSKK